MTVQGVWATGAAYTGNTGGTGGRIDAVTFGGSLYVCKKTTAASNTGPNVDTGTWELYVSGGAGGGGPVGPIGATGEFSYNTGTGSTGSAALKYEPLNAPPSPYLGTTGPQIQVAAHIIPKLDLTYDLGCTGHRFRDLYMSGTTIHMGGATIGAKSGNLQVNGANITDSVTVPSPTIATGFSLYRDLITPFYTDGTYYYGLPGKYAVSSDGQYITYLSSNGTNPGNIHVSNNSGDSFSYPVATIDPHEEASPYTGLPMNARRYAAVAMSSSGQYQIVVEGEDTETNKGYGVFISKDYGVSWTEVWGWRWVQVGPTGEWVPPENQNNWSGVAMSGDGGRIILMITGDYNYYYTNVAFEAIYRNTSLGQPSAAFTNATFAENANPSLAYNQYYMSSSGDRFTYLDNMNGEKSNIRTLYWNPLAFNWGQYTANKIDLNSGSNPPFNNSTSIRYVLSRDGSFIGVYGYYFNNGSMTFELKCARYSWGLPNSAPVIVGDLITVASSASVTSYGIPAAMTADGQVQMVSSWDGVSPPNTGTNGTFISYNGGSTWVPSELSSIKCYAMFFSPDGSYTTAFVVNPTGSVKAIKQAYTATPTATNILNPFVTSDETQWPTAYQPGGPASIQEALDLIARFMKASAGDTATFVAWNTFT